MKRKHKRKTCNFILIGYTRLQNKAFKYQPNFILVKPRKHFLLVITWRFKMLMTLIKSPKCLVLYAKNKYFLVGYIKPSRFIDIIYKRNFTEITDVYYKIRHLFRVFLYKRTLMVLESKNINFILIFPSALVVILWRCRRIMFYKISSKNYIIKYIMNFLSIYLSKWYLYCVNYLEQQYITIQKVIRNFSLNKERTFIGYQSNIRDYSWPSAYLFDHLYKHTLGIYDLMSSIRIDSYIFIPNKESPKENACILID